jgi:hypothetical protein
MERIIFSIALCSTLIAGTTLLSCTDKKADQGYTKADFVKQLLIKKKYKSQHSFCHAGI